TMSISRQNKLRKQIRQQLLPKKYPVRLLFRTCTGRSILDNEEKTPQKIKDGGGGGGGIENSMILHNGKEQYYQSRKDVARRIALRAKYLEDNTGYGDEEEDIYSSSHSTAENTVLIAEMPHVTKQPSFQVPTTSNASKIILIRNVNNRTVPILLGKYRVMLDYKLFTSNLCLCQYKLPKA
ncbi:unnamed protein product, partial [Didymodactylos carnosus]